MIKQFTADGKICCPPILLNPINTWLDKNAYIATRDKLAHMFIQNFKRYEDVKEGIEFSKFGPKI